MADAGAPLPASAVTVLVSDFADSARLWRRSVEAMGHAVWLHRELVLSAAAECGGTPIEESDSEFVAAAFARPSDALTAAVEIRDLLRSRTWPEQLGRHVRLAVHTHTLRRLRLGAPGGGFDVARSRCLGLCAVGRAGQTLLSRMTRDLVVDALPWNTDLVDVGVRRLPDMGSPEHVYQLVSTGVLEEVGGLRSLDTLPNNLPAELTSFIGREWELRQVLDLLEDARLVTLTGSGGVGKTRLALQAAARAIGRFPDGVWWVELAHLADPALMAQALARVLGVRSLPGHSELDAVIRRLADSEALVVLDNCEHVVEAVGDIAQALLNDCPEVKVLATSRVRLGVSKGTTWPVPSMSLPERDDELSAALARSDAARLFLARALEVSPDLELTESNAAALVEICSDLDGIPLALELAAARVSALSIEQIQAALADRLRLLAGGARGPLTRHGTLRASVDWSHELLSERERALFRRLGVFAGGFTLEAAEAVGADPDQPADVLELLVALVEKSIVAADDRGPAVRYRLLETVREYALERLDNAGEAHPVRDRHRDYFLALAEDAARKLVTTRSKPWLELLDAEKANMRAALDRASETEPTKALRLCAALSTWWRLRGQFAEADAAIVHALDTSKGQVSALRAQVEASRAYLLAFAGRAPEGVQVAQEALRLSEQVGDESAAARSLFAAGTIPLRTSPVETRDLFQRARSLAAASGDEWCFAAATCGTGFTYVLGDDHDEAWRLFEECLSIVERRGDQEWASWTLLGMSLRYIERDLRQFFALAERAASLAREVGQPGCEGGAQAAMARAEVTLGQPARALERIESCRQRVIAAGAGLVLPEIEVALALAKATLGDLDSARAGLDAVAEAGADLGWILSWALLERASVSEIDQDLEAGEHYARLAIDAGERIHSRARCAWGRQILGRIAARRGDWSTARRFEHEALDGMADLDVPVRMIEVLDDLAEIAAAAASYEEAVRLLGAAERGRSDLGTARWAPRQPRFDALERDLRQRLRDESFTLAWEAGATLSIREAVAWVRRR
jgi:predicted ATPase